MLAARSSNHSHTHKNDGTLAPYRLAEKSLT